MLCVLWKLLARHDSLWTSQVYLHGFSPHLPHYRRTHAVLQTWLEKIPQEKWLHECKIYIYSNTSIKREEWWWHALHKCYLYNIMLYLWYLYALCNHEFCCNIVKSKDENPECNTNHQTAREDRHCSLPHLPRLLLVQNWPRQHVAHCYHKHSCAKVNDITIWYN